nr:response regulator [Chloroflexota bacterium]
NDKRQYIFILSVMGLGFILSIAGFNIIGSREGLLVRDEFEQAARERVQTVTNDFNANIEVLFNIRSLYSSSDAVDRDDFSSFVEHSLSQNPNIQALEWVPRVSASDRSEYERKAQSDGFQDYQFVEQQSPETMVPAAVRPNHYPVYYLEPAQGNEAALGYDMASDLVRLEALANSRDTGRSVATGRITLVETADKVDGFMVSLPVYRHGFPTFTVADRRENLIGFVVGVYKTGAIVNPATAEVSIEGQTSAIDSNLHISVYDRTAHPDNQLFSQSDSQTIGESEKDTGLRFIQTIAVAGRTWEIVVTSSSSRIIWQSWGLLGGGFLLTGLLLFYILAALSRTATVERLVGQRTYELSEANEQLLEEVDIRRQIESQLQGSEAGIRAILDATVDGIITIDETGGIESFNHAAERIFGFSADEIIGRNVRLLMPDADEALHDGYLEQYLKTGEKKIIGAEREAKGRRRDGTIFPIDIAVNEVQLADRRLFTGIVRDISERKKLEGEIELYTESLERAYAELQQLDELKDNFLSSVSHELRTPLTAIKGSAEILLDGQGVNPEIHEEFLSIINSECDRLTRLINDVLDLARMDAGQERWNDSAHNLGDIVTTAVSTIQALAIQKQIEIVVNLEDELPGVQVDKDKIVQVLTNLLSNAIKFTPDEGVISISGVEKGAVDKGGRFVEIKVSDNGTGIEPDDLEKIFQKFKQVGDIASDIQRGTGLGLPICKEIVGHYNGIIWAESDLDKGSVFTFTLPIHVGALAGETSSFDGEGSSLPVSARKKTILVVDDEDHVRRLLNYEFSQRGYLVVEARNGGEAIELARTQRPDLITMDVLMPVLDGYDATKLIKGDPATKDIPILILSIVENGEMGIEIGANQFISKPFAVEEMLSSVTRLLDGANKKVLIADDDKILAETLRFQFEQKGFVPMVVHHGKAALESIENEPPDLVVLDLLMPDVDGFETLSEMKRRPAAADIPVIVLSGLEIDGVKVRALSLGATDFVPKAAGLSRLYEEIEGILAN